MSQTILILGRQPALGLAELESLYGGNSVRSVGEHAALVELADSEVNFARLGGSVKSCKLLTVLDTTELRAIEKYLLDVSPEHASMLGEGKLTIGLSSYGFKFSPVQLNATGLNIKKTIRKHSGRSVRLVPNNETALSSAQVYHNHLTAERAWELVLVRDGDKTLLAQTIAVQDIDSYTLRDRGRPKRDTRVGMLPPKLAQIIINLAGKHVVPDGAVIDPEHPTTKNPRTTRLLDPFCGTGVLLQEALLLGYEAYGTDLEQRMVDYSRQNLDWLAQKYNFSGNSRLEQGDATSHAWQKPVDIVASETYLGKPFTSTPPSAVLAATIADCNLIIKKFNLTTE